VIAAARLGVLLLVAAAAVWALVPGQRPWGRAAGAKGAHACPMHPEVTAAAAGQCPICGMALVKVEPPAAVELPGTQGRSGAQAERFLSFGATPVHRRTLPATAESPAWLDAQGGVTAVLFEDELRALAPQEPGSFFAARAPGRALPVERTEAAPAPGRGSKWLVRFRFRSGGPPPGLREGATGWVERPTGDRESLVVVSSAVLQAGAGPYLLAISPDRRSYHRRPIAAGRQASGYTVVLSGAAERELVFGVNAFSLDAAARLQAQRETAAQELER
jgi:hypothetical protein